MPLTKTDYYPGNIFAIDNSAVGDDGKLWILVDNGDDKMVVASLRTGIFWLRNRPAFEIPLMKRKLIDYITGGTDINADHLRDINPDQVFRPGIFESPPGPVDPNPRIKCRLEVWGQKLMFQILDMDNRFRSRNGRGYPSYHTGNGWRIGSAYSPEISVRDKDLYLRGRSRESDLEIVSHSFSTQLKAEQARDKIKEALKDWAQNWEGWR